MNDRARALRILEQARDALAQRLTDRILAAAEEILDDAGGQRYLSDIDQLYDELGMKLAHVNSMLAHLPPAPAEADDSVSGDSEASEIAPFERRDFFPAAAGPSRRLPCLALPAPAGSSPVLADPAHDLHGFLRAIQRGDLLAAATLLGLLFELEIGRAQRCADVFAVQAALRPELYTRVMRLKAAVQGRTGDQALALVHECFGLDRFEAAAAVKVLERRLGFTIKTQIW